MTKYQRPPGSIDVRINEIPDGTYRVKIIATVVNMAVPLITLNDGTGTITLEYQPKNYNDLGVKSIGRFICEIVRKGDLLTGKIIAWNPIDKETINRYWKLVGIERRLPTRKKEE